MKALRTDLHLGYNMHGVAVSGSAAYEFEGRSVQRRIAAVELAWPARLLENCVLSNENN